MPVLEVTVTAGDLLSQTDGRAAHGLTATRKGVKGFFRKLHVGAGCQDLLHGLSEVTREALRQYQLALSFCDGTLLLNGNDAAIHLVSRETGARCHIEIAGILLAHNRRMVYRLVTHYMTPLGGLRPAFKQK